MYTYLILQYRYSSKSKQLTHQESSLLKIGGCVITLSSRRCLPQVVAYRSYTLWQHKNNTPLGFVVLWFSCVQPTLIFVTKVLATSLGSSRRDKGKALFFFCSLFIPFRDYPLYAA